MKDQRINFTEEEIAKHEKHIKASELLEEIFLALKDCFEGGISCCESNTVYVLPNGQKFKITATEIN